MSKKVNKKGSYQKLCRIFTQTNKGLIVAPAGHGKTYTIPESVSASSGKYLILTHTHAGIASIKQKFNSKNVDQSRYKVETISGYAQKYVLAYTQKKHVPAQENSKEYYSFLYTRMLELLERNDLQTVIQSTYRGILVDEYQDCNAKQHKMIINLSKILQVQVLGDGMQSIFTFEENPIDWETVKKDFTLVGELDKQWRWINSGVPELGQEISDIRKKLLKKAQIDLADYTHIENKQVSSKNPIELFSTISEILNKEKNVLVIEADSANRAKRLNLVKKFKGRLYMLESIDERSFYDLAKLIDSMQVNFYDKLLLLVKGEKSKTKGKRKGGLITGFSSFLKDGTKPVNSRDTNLKPLYTQIIELTSSFNLRDFKTFLISLEKIDGAKTPSRDLYQSIIKAIDLAIAEEISVYEGMVKTRNNLRRVGREIHGKVIGTTLLTKGLEADCVIIIDADHIPDEKNFYVAISRASKRLVILSEQTKFKFSPKVSKKKATGQVESKQLSLDL